MADTVDVTIRCDVLSATAADVVVEAEWAATLGMWSVSVKARGERLARWHRRPGDVQALRDHLSEVARAVLKDCQRRAAAELAPGQHAPFDHRGRRPTGRGLMAETNPASDEFDVPFTVIEATELRHALHVAFGHHGGRFDAETIEILQAVDRRVFDAQHRHIDERFRARRGAPG